MTRMGGGASKDLGRRAFGTAGGWRTSREAPGRFGRGIGPEKEILRTPDESPAPKVWKPRAGRIYNFPVRRAGEEK